MIRIKKDRSAIIPDTERHIGFENDHLIETRLFCIEDTALADFTFKLDIENTDVVSLTPVAASEAAVSGMLLEWPVTRDALGSGGLICAQLRAFDADGNRVWHSEKMEFTAGESVHTAANASDPATITEFEQIEKKVTQALASMDAVYDDVTGKYSEIVQMGEDYTAAMKAVDTLSEQAGAHYADKANPHEVTAEQLGAYTKTETDGKIVEAVTPVESDVISLEGAVAGKLDKVSSFVRVYPGVYATIETDGTPHLITATSDLGYIGNTAANQYLPLYAAGGQLKTATPTEADSAANKGYVDGKVSALTKPYELIETITLTEATNLIERSSEPDGTEYNFKNLLIYMNAALTDKTGACGVNLWDGTTLVAQNLAFGSEVTQTSSNYLMEISVEDGILRQSTPETSNVDYQTKFYKTAAATFVGGVKMMDKISKFTLRQFNGYTFAVGTVIKIYGVRA